MNKKFKKFVSLCVTSTFFLTICPLKVSAQENDIKYSELFSEVSEISQEYSKIGITDGELIELLNIIPPSSNNNIYKSNETLKIPESVVEYYKNNPTRKFYPSKYNLDLTNVEQYDGDDYDGNPPYNDEEQCKRIDYLLEVFNNEYGSKYKDNKGKYLTYLYTSHYTENINYDRTKPANFDSVYANIISQSDIEAFDKFYSFTSTSAIIDSFISLSDSISNIEESGIGKGVLKESLKEAKEIVSDDVKNIISLFESLGFVDATSIREKMNKIYVCIKDNATSVDDAEELINVVTGELNKEGISGVLINTLITSLGNISSNPVLIGTIAPVLGGVSFYVSTLCKAIPVAALAGLYYSYHIRQTERFYIYIGMGQRP